MKVFELRQEPNNRFRSSANDACKVISGKVQIIPHRITIRWMKASVEEDESLGQALPDGFLGEGDHPLFCLLQHFGERYGQCACEFGVFDHYLVKIMLRNEAKGSIIYRTCTCHIRGSGDNGLQPDKFPGKDKPRNELPAVMPFAVHFDRAVPYAINSLCAQALLEKDLVLFQAEDLLLFIKKHKVFLFQVGEELPESGLAVLAGMVFWPFHAGKVW